MKLRNLLLVVFFGLSQAHAKSFSEWVQDGKTRVEAGIFDAVRSLGHDFSLSSFEYFEVGVEASVRYKNPSFNDLQVLADERTRLLREELSDLRNQVQLYPNHPNAGANRIRFREILIKYSTLGAGQLTDSQLVDPNVVGKAQIDAVRVFDEIRRWAFIEFKFEFEPKASVTLSDILKELDNKTDLHGFDVGVSANRKLTFTYVKRYNSYEELKTDFPSNEWLYNENLWFQIDLPTYGSYSKALNKIMKLAFRGHRMELNEGDWITIERKSTVAGAVGIGVGNNSFLKADLGTGYGVSRGRYMVIKPKNGSTPGHNERAFRIEWKQNYQGKNPMDYFANYQATWRAVTPNRHSFTLLSPSSDTWGFSFRIKGELFSKKATLFESGSEWIDSQIESGQYLANPKDSEFMKMTELALDGNFEEFNANVKRVYGGSIASGYPKNYELVQVGIREERKEKDSIDIWHFYDHSSYLTKGNGEFFTKGPEGNPIREGRNYFHLLSKMKDFGRNTKRFQCDGVHSYLPTAEEKFPGMKFGCSFEHQEHKSSEKEDWVQMKDWGMPLIPGTSVENVAKRKEFNEYMDRHLKELDGGKSVKLRGFLEFNVKDFSPAHFGRITDDELLRQEAEIRGISLNLAKELNDVNRNKILKGLRESIAQARQVQAEMELVFHADPADPKYGEIRYESPVVQEQKRVFEVRSEYHRNQAQSAFDSARKALNTAEIAPLLNRLVNLVYHNAASSSNYAVVLNFLENQKAELMRVQAQVRRSLQIEFLSGPCCMPGQSAPEVFAETTSIGELNQHIEKMKSYLREASESWKSISTVAENLARNSIARGNSAKKQALLESEITQSYQELASVSGNQQVLEQMGFTRDSLKHAVLTFADDFRIQEIESTLKELAQPDNRVLRFVPKADDPSWSDVWVYARAKSIPSLWNAIVEACSYTWFDCDRLDRMSEASDDQAGFIIRGKSKLRGDSSDKEALSNIAQVQLILDQGRMVLVNELAELKTKRWASLNSDLSDQMKVIREFVGAVVDQADTLEEAAVDLDHFRALGDTKHPKHQVAFDQGFRLHLMEKSRPIHEKLVHKFGEKLYKMTETRTGLLAFLEWFSQPFDLYPLFSLNLSGSGSEMSSKIDIQSNIPLAGNKSDSYLFVGTYKK